MTNLDTKSGINGGHFILNSLYFDLFNIIFDINLFDIKIKIPESVQIQVFFIIYNQSLNVNISLTSFPVIL